MSPGAIRILLLEDDPHYAELAQRYLQAAARASANIECAGTLAAALERIARGSFDLVVADLDLPDSRGLATVQALTASGHHPVIVLTGNEEPGLRERVMEAGAYDFLAKNRLDNAALERVVRLAATQARSFRSLRESEERFRALTELSSDIYWTQDTDLRFTAFAGSRYWASAIEQRKIGKRRWDEVYFNMNEARWAAHRAVLEARQPFRDLELGRINEQGEMLWVSVSGAPVFDHTGRFAGYRGVGRDITVRKRDEQLLELEHQVTRLLAEAPSELAGLQAAMRAICETQSWECGRYLRVDETANLLRLGEAWVAEPAVAPFIESSRRMVYAPGYGLAGLAWQSGAPLWVTDVSSDSRTVQKSVVLQVGLQGAIFFPLKSEGRTIGVLAFNTRQLREPDERLLEAVRVIGSQIGQFVRRKQAEAVVRESEERFRSLTMLSSDTYWEQDAGLRFTSLTGRGAAQLTSGERSFIGRRLEELGFVNLSEADWAAHRAVREAHQPFRDLELCRLDGSGEKVWASVSGEPVFDPAGGFTGYRGVGKDISARKRAQQLLSLEHTVTRHLAEAESVSAALKSAIRTVCESQGWECGRYYHADDEAGVLRYGEGWGIDDPAIARYLEASRDEVYSRDSGGAKVRVWRSGEPLWTSEMGRRSGLAWSILGKARDAFAFAVTAEGKVLGVVSFTHREVRKPDERLLQTVRVVGSQIGQFLRRKRAEEHKAAHLRYQEKIARFGQSAIGRLEAAELVEDAVQSVLEALGVEAVAYLEPGHGEREVALRSLVGLAEEPGVVMAGYAPGSALARALERGEAALSESAPALPFAWAAPFKSAALAPVTGERRTRGVLCGLAKEPGMLGEEETRFLAAAASVLSSGLLRIDSETRIAFLAQFDTLTGLPNRALLADRFSQMIVLARRRGTPMGVLFIDLDEFKLVNDTLGHAAGDELLKETARRLQASVRSSDTVARISGDEFAVVLNDLARPDDAGAVAQKIIERLAAPVQLRGHEVFVTASIGIAAYPADGQDAEALLGAADAAMYRAKQSGRNAYQFFTAEINQRTRARAQLGSELRRALEREEFMLVYQPRFRLGAGQACGAEALLRWNHPQRGVVAPAEFIPVLEETGLIVPVGEWVLQRACIDLKAWQAAGLCQLPVAVNLSARQFRQQDLDSRIRSLVNAAGVDATLIELEITESQLMQDPEQAIRVMLALREAGMRLAIDDFGTGYSSLAYLTRLPVGALKIDRSFIAKVLAEEADAAVVRAIVDMAHTLGFTVVAEGVETQGQAAFLRRVGCDEAQGYLFARPMPVAQFVERVLSPAGAPQPGKRRPGKRAVRQAS
jgi:diguanylate cyclase (GGDEF)-like protein/PAS domain S-box-containing protein